MGLFENDPLLMLPFMIAGAALWDGVKAFARSLRMRRAGR